MKCCNVLFQGFWYMSRVFVMCFEGLRMLRVWNYGKDGNWDFDLFSWYVPCVSLHLDQWELKDVVKGITVNAGLALILNVSCHVLLLKAECCDVTNFHCPSFIFFQMCLQTQSKCSFPRLQSHTL